jgi:hypothetical protein
MILRRRSFLAGCLHAATGLALTPLLGAAEPQRFLHPTARRCILLTMAGGMSHLDTFDPKEDPAIAGETTAIPTSVDGLRIGHHLPMTARQMHHMALIRSVTSTQGAHEQGSYYVRTGQIMRGETRHPSLAAWASYHLGQRNPSLPASVLIGGGAQHPRAGFLPARHAPLPIGDPDAGLQHSRRPAGVDAQRLDRRLAWLAEMETGDLSPEASAYRDLRRDAVALMASPDLAAFDLAGEDPATAAWYGDTDIGRGCLLARRLVERDVPFVEVELGGWDHHNDLWGNLPELAAGADRALAALIVDLRRRGLLDETLVVVASEFGRTPRINEHRGRDHHPACFTIALAGGGVRGGAVHGASDDRGDRVARDPVTVPDVLATIGWALGMPVDQVVTAPNGRPFTTGNHGAPLRGLFA